MAVLCGFSLLHTGRDNLPSIWNSWFTIFIFGFPRKHSKTKELSTITTNVHIADPPVIDFIRNLSTDGTVHQVLGDAWRDTLHQSITVWLCCRSNEGLSIFWSVRFLFVEPMLTVITDQEIYVCHQLRSCPLIRNRLHMLITMACFTGNGCQNICTLSDMVVTAVNNQSICIVY